MFQPSFALSTYSRTTGVETPDAGMDRFSTTAEPKGVCWVRSFFKDVWLQRYVKETVKTKMDQQANHDVVYRET